MHKLLAVFSWVLTSYSSFGQTLTSEQVDGSGCQQLYFITANNNCQQATELARRDLQAHLPFLLLTSGEAPVVFTTDAVFERNFGVHYLEEGCVSPPLACVERYNACVFDYLQATYGKIWQRQVRKDVVGLRKWKKAYHAR